MKLSCIVCTCTESFYTSKLANEKDGIIEWLGDESVKENALTLRLSPNSVEDVPCSKKGTPEYDRWKAEHLCDINDTKSSGDMEGFGAVKMFECSIERHNLIYNEYLGDWETSSFNFCITMKR